MMIYVAQRYGGSAENLKQARKITHALAVDDTKNTYICPLLALSHLGHKEIDREDEIEQRLDILTCCEMLIVASEPSGIMRREIDLARRLGMEVHYLDRAFTE